MKTGIILTVSFIIGIITLVIGAMFKIMHYPGADTFLVIGILTWLVFVITALYEVQRSTTINRTEKLMWTVGFILIAGITAIIYLLFRRGKVVSRTSVE
ncbi:hypothetical protein BH10BAC2_BH10BAC2_44670 [soil metagenome]